MPILRKGGLARAGYGIVETAIVVAVVAVLIFVVVNHYSRNLSESRETALRSELATLRNTINLFTAIKGRCPGTLSELISTEYALPYKAGITEIAKGEGGNIEVKEKVFFNPRYLEAYALDDSGNILDPFGNPYEYDASECAVYTMSPGYEKYNL